MRFEPKWRKAAIAIVAVLIAAQVSASVLVRSRGMHKYLEGRLESAFGRPVQVGHFNVSLLPKPVLDADEITVGEDPQFGSEYFLRAERLTAGLRWSGLFRGHFELGTLSLAHASLILVRDREGSWNMERWLPPANSTLGAGNRFYGPRRQLSPSNHLREIEVSDGRINFKIVDEKTPFALVGVSARIEQVAPGRWHLELNAQPWSSGVTLQSAGALLVRGDVAGTSTRLQPAEIHVHWEKVSLADLFRIFRAQDYGVRGIFALDGVAKSDDDIRSAGRRSGDWSFSVQARAEQIHRWDLTERADDPAVNLNLQGRWNTIARNVIAERVSIETPGSNLRGTARFDSSAAPSWEVRVDSAGVQARDLLAWYRAFDPRVDKVVTAEEFFTGAFTLRGWPLEVQDAAFSSSGGQLRLPGADAVVHIGAFQGGRNREQFVIGPAEVSYEAGRSSRAGEKIIKASAARTVDQKPADLKLAFAHDFSKHAGTLNIEGRVQNTQEVLSLLTALGKPINRGWDLSGPSDLHLTYGWDASKGAKWNGHVEFSGNALQIAGLNLPVQVNKARLEWIDGLRSVRIGDAEGFGGNWSGQITQLSPGDIDTPPRWIYQLRADHLDAADLDRWIGPRARPSWLQRLLPTLLGSAATLAPSELLRRINADGELRIDEFVVEKVRLKQVRALGGLHEFRLDFRQADARCAGGQVRARIRASFLPRPNYEVAGEFHDVDLKELPSSNNLAERFSGIASGVLQLNLQGIGRDELLEHVTGKGELNLRDVAFRGWDARATMTDGEPHEGASHWSSAEGAFQLRDGSITFPALRLEAGADLTLLKGTFPFASNSSFTIEPFVDEQVGTATPNSSNGFILKVAGSTDAPKISVERLVARRRTE